MDHLTGTNLLIPGGNPFWVAIGVFALSYLLVIADHINRSIIALLGAGVMVVSGVLSQDEAIRGIDFNTIALLTGMMILVAISRKSGMFQYAAIWAAKQARASPAGILLMLSLVTAVLSSLLDNVTTVLLIVPVTLAITSELDVPPYPFLFAEVFASNIGGTATDQRSNTRSLIASRAFIAITRSRACALARSRRPHTRCVISACTAITTMITGVRWTTNSLKLILACVPIRILGGSPIRVAVPPIFEANTSANRNG